MDWKVRDALNRIDMDGLRCLASQRRMSPGRSKEDHRQSLARSYKADFETLFGDCRKRELVQVLEGGFPSGNSLLFHFTNLSAANVDDLRAVALQVYEEGWEPDLDEDGDEVEGPIVLNVEDLEEWADAEDDDDEDEDEEELDDRIVDDGEEDEEEDDGEPDESGEDDASPEDEADDARSADWHWEHDFTAGPGLEPPEGISQSHHALAAHQVRSLRALRTWWEDSGRTRGVLCLPTGAGKTRVASRFVLDLVSKDQSVLWLTHRSELMDQAIAAFLSTGHQAGMKFRVARFGRSDLRGEVASEVVVGMVSSLAWGGGDLPNVGELLELHGRFDLVVVDECHHAVAASWRRVIQGLLKRCPGVRLLGLSATPTRTATSERPQFWKLFSEIIHEEPALQLIREGILARPHLHVVETHRDYRANDEDRRHARKFKDLSSRLVVEISRDVDRNHLIAKALGDDLPRWGKTVLFAATRAQAEKLGELLERRRVTSAYVDGETPMEEREAAVASFKDPGGVQVIINVGLFTEGTDLPGAQSVFIARPTQSQILFQQMIGRGLRGPVFGGTRQCNIVSFHDRVHGLFEESVNGYAFEQQTLGELGTGDGETATQARQAAQVETTAVDEPSPDEVSRRARVEAQAEVLRKVLLARGPRPDMAATPESTDLVGWWELPEPNRSFFPVFREEQEALSPHLARVSDWLQHGGQVPLTLEEMDVEPGSNFARFVSAAIERRAAPSWMTLEDSTVEGAVEMTSGVLGVPPVPVLPVTNWVEKARLKVKAAASGAVEVELDGRARAVLPGAYEAARRFWQERGTQFVGKTVEMQRERFATYAELGALPTDISRDLLECFVAESVARGAFPEPSAERSPEVQDIVTAIRSMPAAERGSALQDIRRAWFEHSMSPEVFLMEVTNAVLDGRT